MNEKPCQKEYDEFTKATIEWVEASDAVSYTHLTLPTTPYV